MFKEEAAAARRPLKWQTMASLSTRDMIDVAAYLATLDSTKL